MSDLDAFLVIAFLVVTVAIIAAVTAVHVLTRVMETDLNPRDS